MVNNPIQLQNSFTYLAPPPTLGKSLNDLKFILNIRNQSS